MTGLRLPPRSFDAPPMAQRTLDESRRRALGRRWLPGIVSVFLGALGLFAVLCLHYPALLTTPELRAVYPMPLVRTAICLLYTSDAADEL